MHKSTRRGDLLIIGNLTLDVVHEVDRIPEIDKTGLVLRQNTHFGGRAGNIGIVGTKLGLNVAIASVVGGDFVESGYRDYLTKHKVNIDMTKIVKSEKCAKIHVFRQRDGSQVYFFQPNVQQYSHGLNFGEEELKKFKIIYFTSFNSEKPILDLMKKLIHHNSIFFGFGEEIYRKSRDFLGSVIDVSSYLDLNELELETLLKKMEFSAVNNIFDMGTKLEFICVSSGEKGSVIYTRNEKYLIPAVPPRNVVSTLGAGDAYVAGLIYGIINEWNIEARGRLGSTLSSFILEGEGAQNRVPNWESLRERYTEFFGEPP